MPSKRTVPRVCAHCGSEFLARISEVNRGDAVYCERACKDQATRTADRRAARFWARVQKTETCWVWTGARQPHGYGVLCRTRLVDGRRKPRLIMAHRYAYELTYGPFDPSLFVCHHCDMPICVRPDHLFLGTNRDNVDDKMRKGRHRSTPMRGAANGAAILTEAAVLAIRERYATGGISQRALGVIYGVSAAAIYTVVNGIRWAHVTAPGRTRLP